MQNRPNKVKINEIRGETLGIKAIDILALLAVLAVPLLVAQLFAPKKEINTPAVEEAKATDSSPGIILTGIGSINAIINEDNQIYYLNIESPIIRGETEPNAYVYFYWVEMDRIYETQSDSFGVFEVTIEHPELERTTNTIKYYATNQSGEQGETVTIVLVVGEENFSY